MPPKAKKIKTKKAPKIPKLRFTRCNQGVFDQRWWRMSLYLKNGKMPDVGDAHDWQYLLLQLINYKITWRMIKNRRKDQAIESKICVCISANMVSGSNIDHGSIEQHLRNIQSRKDKWWLKISQNMQTKCARSLRAANSLSRWSTLLFHLSRKRLGASWSSFPARTSSTSFWLALGRWWHRVAGFYFPLGGRRWWCSGAGGVETAEALLLWGRCNARCSLLHRERYCWRIE